MKFFVVTFLFLFSQASHATASCPQTVDIGKLSDPSLLTLASTKGLNNCKAETIFEIVNGEEKTFYAIYVSTNSPGNIYDVLTAPIILRELFLSGACN